VRLVKQTITAVEILPAAWHTYLFSLYKLTCTGFVPWVRLYAYACMMCLWLGPASRVYYVVCICCSHCLGPACVCIALCTAQHCVLCGAASPTHRLPYWQCMCDDPKCAGTWRLTATTALLCSCNLTR
jgi:hypothetical protein